MALVVRHLLLDYERKRETGGVTLHLACRSQWVAQVQQDIPVDRTKDKLPWTWEWNQVRGCPGCFDWIIDRVIQKKADAEAGKPDTDDPHDEAGEKREAAKTDLINIGPMIERLKP